MPLDDIMSFKLQTVRSEPNPRQFPTQGFHCVQQCCITAFADISVSDLVDIVFITSTLVIFTERGSNTAGLVRCIFFLFWKEQSSPSFRFESFENSILLRVSNGNFCSLAEESDKAGPFLGCSRTDLGRDLEISFLT